MMRVHIQLAKILRHLDDELYIVGVDKVPRNFRPDCETIRCHALLSTPHGKPRFVGTDFETDGLGCFRLFYWICLANIGSRPRTIRRKFDDLFYADPIDALKAVMYIFKGKDRNAHGELGYHCRQQWANQPEKMLMISRLGATDLDALLP